MGHLTVTPTAAPGSFKQIGVWQSRYCPCQSKIFRCSTCDIFQMSRQHRHVAKSHTPTTGWPRRACLRLIGCLFQGRRGVAGSPAYIFPAPLALKTSNQARKLRPGHPADMSYLAGVLVIFYTLVPSTYYMNAAWCRPWIRWRWLTKTYRSPPSPKKKNNK